MTLHFFYIIEIYFSILGFIIFPLLIRRLQVSPYIFPFLSSSVIGGTIFLFSIFGFGKTGVLVVRFTDILLLILSIMIYFRRKRIRRDESIITNSQWLFLLVFTVLFFGLGMLSKLWFYHAGLDEFSFWDVYVRSFMRYGEKIAATIHPTYPVGISVFQYYFSAVAVQNEHIVYFAITYLILTGALFIFSTFHKKTNRLMLPTVLLICLCLLYLCGRELFTLYAEGVIGILFGAFVIALYHEKDPDRVHCILFSIMFCFFIQMKDVCIAFVTGTLLLTAVSWFFDRKQEGDTFAAVLKRFSRADILNFLILLIPALMTSLIWKIRNEVKNVTDIFDFSQISLGNILTMVSPDGSDWHRTLWTNIVETLFRVKYTFTGVSPFVFALILLSFAIVLYVLYRDQKFLVINSCLFLGLILFNLIQNLHFLFSMEKELAEILESYDRYLSSYFIGWSIFIVTFLLGKVLSTDSKENQQRGYQYLLLTAVGFILLRTPMDKIFSIPPRQDERWIKTQAFYADYSEFIPTGSNVKMLSPSFWYEDHSMMRDLFVGQASIIRYNDDELISQFNATELRMYLNREHIRFICIGYVDEDFWNSHPGIFDQPVIDDKAYHLYQRVSPGKYELVDRE